MKYCIRGKARIWGGHQIELMLEMAAWLDGRCGTRYHIVRFDEAKFRDRADAEQFARKWFEPGHWRLREMDQHCGMACTLDMRRLCAPTHAQPPGGRDTRPVPPDQSFHHS